MPKAVAALAFASSLAIGATGVRAQSQAVMTAAAVVAEVDRLAARDLWPGFDPRHTPIAIYDGTRTLLFCHPSPPEGFLAVPGQATVTTFDGRYPAVTANSSAQIGGVQTATLMPPVPGATLTTRAGVAIHEAFHVFQRTRHPAWAANEADLFTYPMADATQLAARRREYALFRRALSSADAGSAACDAFVAMSERRERFARLGAAGSTYERKSELNEGLANYVEMRAIGATDLIAVPSVPVTPDGIRSHVYLSGTALARLLDRFAPTWRDMLERGDPRSLDEILSQALGRTNTERPNCGLDAAARADIDRDADRDATGLKTSLLAERVRFLAAPGWQVVVEASRNVLFPNGFDPLNVKRVTDGEVLHTRFVKLGNATGAIEVIGRGTLSESAGAHPLFNGVRLVTVTGLDAEPVVTDAAGAVKVVVPGVNAEFRGAAVQREGKVIRLVLGAVP